MIKLGTLFWEMAVDSRGLNDGLQDGERQVQTFANRTEVGLNKATVAFSALGLAAVKVADDAARAFVSFTKDSIALASAAEEAGSKFDVVFGAGARQAEADLAAMAGTVQRSKYELKEMAASVQDVFVPLGFAREEAQKLSLTLTQLAVDVGSFNNVADGEVMAAFQSALIGNHEAVRRFGIVISEATLSQELMNMGIEKGVQGATELEKVQARLNLLFRMTGDAQGDAARTADSWANTMRGLESAIRDVQTDIGNELLPVLTPMLVDLTTFARDVAPVVVRQVGMIAEAFVAMTQSLQQVDLSQATAQFQALEGAINVDFWSEVFGFIARQISLTVTNFRELGAEIGRLAQEFDLFKQWISGDIGWDEYRAQMIDLRTAYQEVVAEFQRTYDEINGKDWSGVINAQVEINTQNEVAAQRWQAVAEAARVATATMTESVAPAMQSMADVWASVWEQIQGISTAGADGVRNQVFNSFSEMAQEYAGHAEAIVQIEQERDQYLLYLEATYQQQAAALKAAGNTADLANLAAAHQAKYNSALGYYNGRIKLEQVGQKTIYDTARQYYAATLRTLITQLQAQVRATAAAMKTLVQATVPGYMAMAQAALAFNKAKAGATSIAELTRAIADVQAAMAGIETAGVAAADQAGASFAAWEASVGDLAGNLEDVDSGLGNITRPGGSGSQVRPQVVDPLQEAARTAQTLASMVERAIEAFDALAEFGMPTAGWQDNLQALLDGLVFMVMEWGDAVAQLHNAGLIEGAAKLQTAAKVVSDVAGALAKAIDVLDGMSMPDVRQGAVRAWAEQIVALVEQFKWLTDEIRTGGISDENLATLSTVAERIVKALAPWKAAADAITAIASQSGARVEDAAARLIWQTKLLVEWVDWLRDNLPESDLRLAAARAEQVTKALSPWKAMADAVQAIAGQSGARVEEAATRLIWQAELLVEWVDWVIDYLPEDELQAVADRGELVVKAMAPWKAAADAVQAVVNQSGARVEDAAARLIWQVELLVDWVNWLVEWLPPGKLEQAAARAGDIVKALSPWKAASDAINAIASSAGVRIEDAAQRMIWQVELLVDWVNWLVEWLPPGKLEQAAARAGDIVKALSPWKAASDAINAISKTTTAPVVQAARRLLAIVAGLIEDLAAAARDIGIDDLEFAARVGGLIDDALAPWDKAAKLATELGMWRQLPDFQEKVIRFARTWVEIVRQIGIAAGTLSQAGLNAVGEFSAALESLLSGLEAALALATDFEFEEPDPAMWASFEAWVQSAFVSFYDWVNATGNSWGGQGSAPPVPLFGGAGLDAMNAWAQALVNLMEGLQAALGLARDFDFEEPDPAMWAGFEAWVQSVFVSFYEWVNASGNYIGGQGTPINVPLFGGDGLQAVSDFGDALSALMGGLASALELALALPEEWTEPASWDAFAQWVQDAFGVFLEYVEDNLPEDPEEASTFEPVYIFGEALGALMAGLSNALGLALALPEDWEPPTETTWRAFTDWVQDVFDVFIAYVEDNLPADPEEAAIFEPVAAFGSALSSVMGGLTGALELFIGLEDWSGPSSAFQERLGLFLGYVTQAFADISTYVQANLAPDQMTSVREFGEALSSLVGGLSSALSLFAALADTDPTVYTESNRFEDRVGHLLESISGTLEAFQTWILANASTEWIDPAEDFFAAVEDVFQLLRDGLQLFADLQASGMPPTDLIQAFISTLLGVFGTFASSLAGMAAPGGQIAGAISAIQGLLSSFPASLAPAFVAWGGAGNSLGQALETGLRDRIGQQGQGSASGTIWGALGAYTWTLQQWTPGQILLNTYFDHGEAMAAQLVAGMLSYTGENGEMWEAGYQLAQSGIDGFEAGAAAGTAMANAIAGATPEWAANWSGEASLTSRQMVTVRFEGAAGNPNGLDLTPRAIDAIARELSYKIGRGG